MNEALLYIGGALTIVWGTAHLYPTKQIVRSFGGIARDNQLVLTMEWLSEAVLLIFTGLLVVLMTARFGADAAAAQTVFATSAGICLFGPPSRRRPAGASTSSCIGCARRSSRCQRR